MRARTPYVREDKRAVVQLLGLNKCVAPPSENTAGLFPTCNTKQQFFASNQGPIKRSCSWSPRTRRHSSMRIVPLCVTACMRVVVHGQCWGEGCLLHDTGCSMTAGTFCICFRECVSIIPALLRVCPPSFFKQIIVTQWTRTSARQ